MESTVTLGFTGECPSLLNEVSLYILYMKTNQDMIRTIGDYIVVQRTSDGYFDGMELLRQWNSKEENPKRQMSKFLEQEQTKEFIKALVEDESHVANNLHGDNQVFTKIKGRITKNGKTPDKVWMNPLLFIEFAMWINPTFKVKVLRFVYDEMIKYRNDAGDAYKELSSSVSKIVPKAFMRDAMKKIAEALNWIIFNNHESMIRNKGDEEKLRNLFQLERKVSDLIEDGFITDYNSLIGYLRKLYYKEHCLPVFKTA